MVALVLVYAPAQRRRAAGLQVADIRRGRHHPLHYLSVPGSRPVAREFGVRAEHRGRRRRHRLRRPGGAGPAIARPAGRAEAVFGPVRLPRRGQPGPVLRHGCAVVLRDEWGRRGGAKNRFDLRRPAPQCVLVCFHLHKQQARPSAPELLRGDPRRPVLFLRSFQSDTARVKPVGLASLPLFPAILGQDVRGVPAPAMSKYGPFVGLGNPEDYLPSLCAAKVYQRDDSRRETVLGFLRRAPWLFCWKATRPD